MNSVGRPSRVTWLTGTQRQAVAVREREVLVDPVAVRQRLRVQLARRQHDLAILAVDQVAVVVDRDEVVVGPDLLDLAEGVLQRLMIPERHVAQRHRVGVDVAPGQRRVPGQLALLDTLEREGVPRGGDVVHDERRFARLLVRRHDEALQAGRVDGPADRHQHAQPEGGHQRPDPGLRHLIGGEQHAERRHHDQHPGGRHVGVDVDVGRAGDQAGRRGQHLGNGQPRPGGDDRQPARGEDGRVRRRGRPQLDAAAGAQAQEAGAEVDQADADGGEREEQDRQRVQGAPERQLEHVEADVVAQHRIGLAERRGVPVDEPRLPLRRGNRRHQQGAGRRDQRHDRAQPGRIDDDGARSLRRDHDDLATRQHAERQPQVERQDAEGDGEHGQPQRRLRGQAARVDPLVADLGEPQPVGVELHARRQQEEHRDEQDEQRETAGCHGGPAAIVCAGRGMRRIRPGRGSWPRASRRCSGCGPSPPSSAPAPSASKRPYRPDSG